MNSSKIPNKIWKLFVVAFALAFSASWSVGILFAAVPTITTGGVTGITREIAYPELTVVDDDGTLLSAGFEWGTTTSYGSSITLTGPYSTIATLATTDTGDGYFSAPQGMALDSSGNIYMTDTLHDRVQKLDSAGAFISKFGTTGAGNGQFSLPSGIEIDSSGNIFVVDKGNNRVQKFNSSGVYQSQFGTAGAGDGQFDSPTDIEIDGAGNMFVVDSGNNRVQKFNSSGVYQSQFGTAGAGDGQFDFDGSFNGLAFDSTGNIYVTDRNNSRVQKFNSSGVYQSQFGTSGFGDGEFYLPSGLAIDAIDYVYVVDTDRVQKFDSSGNFISTTGSYLGTAQTYDIEVDSLKDLFVVTAKSDDLTTNNYAVLTKVSQTELSTIISPLVCNTLYHYRGVAANADGTSYGGDATFTTSACDYSALETKDAVMVTTTSAIMTGLQLDDGVGGTTARGFQYGTSTLTATNGTFIPVAPLNFYQSEYIGPNNSYDLHGATAIDMDSSSQIYATAKDNDSVMLFDEYTNLEMKLGWGVDTGASAYEICTTGFSCQDGIEGSGDGQFSAPEGILKDEISENIFVSDTGNNRIQVFDSAGAFLYKFGTAGAGDGQFNAPKGLAIVSSGGIPYLYVVDSGNSRIQKFTTTGTWISSVGSLGSDTGEFNVPTAIAAASDRTLYVADTNNNRIQKIAPDLTVDVVSFSGALSLSSPKGIAIDSKDNIYISDTGNNRIIFTIRETESEYLYMAAFGTIGTGNNQFDSPQGILISDQDLAFIADSNNDRVAYNSSIFSRKIKPLSCGTTYNYRTYATNLDGTGYGNNVSFTTLPCSSGGGGGGGGPTIYGCTDSLADNYDSSATADDGSCTYPPTYYGCTDPSADNYNAAAVSDDGSCTYGTAPVFGCTNPSATNYNPLANQNDGTCIIPGGGGPSDDPDDVPGCTDTFATNFNDDATVDDGSCEYELNPITGCMDSTALNYNLNATVSDGSCTYPPPPDPDPETIPEIIREVIEDIKGYVSGISKNTVVVPVVNTVAVAGLTVPLLLYILAERAGIASVALRLWNIIPTLLGFRRKRRPWGTVYDSVTKQPLDPAYVTLRNPAGAEISTSITDLDGRYGFFAAPGSYKIDAKKTDYVFPSVKLQGAGKDELYDNLYFGESMSVEGEDTIINKNIPMDAINFNWNEFEKGKNGKLMKFFSSGELFLARISKILFIAGLISSAILVLIEPKTFNYIILGVYVVIVVLSLFGIRPKKPGYVIVRATREPLAFAILTVFSATLKREIAHTIVGKTGRYHVLVPKGKYFIKLRQKTGEQTYEDIYTSETFKARKGYIDKVIKI